jgi:hypothetical protein
MQTYLYGGALTCPVFGRPRYGVSMFDVGMGELLIFLALALAVWLLVRRRGH